MMADGIPNRGPGPGGGRGEGDIRCLGLSAAATQPSTPVRVVQLVQLVQLVQAGCSAGRQRFCAGDKNSAVWRLVPPGGCSCQRRPRLSAGRL